MSDESPPLRSDLPGLSEADQHFTQLVAGVRDYAIFLMDPEGRIRSWNEGARRIKGYEADEIVGQSFTRFYTPEAISTGFPQEELRQATEVGRFEDEGWRLRKDGNRFWANVIINALYDDSKLLRGFLKITRDLTERKRAEEALRQSEERFRLLVDNVAEYGIFMLDPDGRISSWNKGAERIKGYSVEEAIGRHFSIFYSSEDQLSGKPELQLAIARRNGSVEDEGWRVRKDRSLFWANVVITALFDADRNLRGFAKVTRDLTDRRAVAELKAADRHKNEFLAMLAHELRNPLAPIANGLQILQLAAGDPGTLKDTTQVMQRQLEHLVRLVDDLLDVSRIITGKISLQLEPVDLGVTITRAIEEVQPFIDSRGHELMVTLPSRPIVIDGDAVRLAQVFSNLLSNAAKYSPEPNQIALSVERHGEVARIRVRDHGVGIEPEVLPTVFDLFVQVDNSLERRHGGLGIGLTLVKRIIELHEGFVSASSAGLGQGSEFMVQLPLSRSGLAHPPPATDRQDAARKLRRKILVVDDNVDAAASVAKLLTLWGHDVHAVFDGKAAIEAVRAFRPEIVLLDIGLPGMSGYEVARQLRADPLSQGLIITALTGYGQVEDQQRSLEAGFNFHITKPLASQALVEILEK